MRILTIALLAFLTSVARGDVGHEIFFPSNGFFQTAEGALTLVSEKENGGRVRMVEVPGTGAPDFKARWSAEGWSILSFLEVTRNGETTASSSFNPYGVSGNGFNAVEGKSIIVQPRIGEELLRQPLYFFDVFSNQARVNCCSGE